MPAPRVCIVAENASLRFGGEASLPLHYFSRLRARGIEAWLIVHGRTKEELEALLPGEQDRIQYIPDEWYHKLLWRMGTYLPSRISNASIGLLMVLINQLIQRAMVRRLILVHGVNIVHQPIPVSPKAPSYHFGFGVPVVIGPMNGGMNYPTAFSDQESIFTRASVAMGRSCANLVNRIIPGKLRADTLMVANERTRLSLPAGAKGNVVTIPENGVDLSIWTLPGGTVVETKVPRFLFVGRLVDWKRLDLVLRALATLPDGDLDVIGDGPMRASWTALAKQEGIGERVRWLGWLPQTDCAKRLHGATALLLPSIYECGGAVILEAMACGVPAVALNWGGPADYIDADSGVLIDPRSADAVVQGFADAMRRLASDRALQSTLGAAARTRVERLFDWNEKTARVLEIYREAIARHSSIESSGSTGSIAAGR